MWFGAELKTMRKLYKAPNPSFDPGGGRKGVRINRDWSSTLQERTETALLSEAALIIQCMNQDTTSRTIAGLYWM